MDWDGGVQRIRVLSRGKGGLAMRRSHAWILAVVLVGGGMWTATWAPDPPTACCLEDGTCVDVEPWECAELGGESAPTGTTCGEWNCEPPPPPPLECRVTGGGVDEFGNWDGTEADGTHGNRSATDRYTFGGQAGAPTASQPQPWGEWTHHQQRGPSGSFVFHAGTASAPEGTEIDLIVCSDPGWCVQARPAPAKQIDFGGVGTFKNMKGAPAGIAANVAVGESLHWFEVNIDDLGEPGGHADPGGCDPLGFGRNGGPELADCDCPDFYRIRIYEGPTDGSAIMYEVYGYIDNGNFQIHPPTGRDEMLTDF